MGIADTTCIIIGDRCLQLWIGSQRDNAADKELCLYRHLRGEDFCLRVHLSLVDDASLLCVDKLIIVSLRSTQLHYAMIIWLCINAINQFYRDELEDNNDTSKIELLMDGQKQAIKKWHEKKNMNEKI